MLRSISSRNANTLSTWPNPFPTSPRTDLPPIHSLFSTMPHHRGTKTGSAAALAATTAGTMWVESGPDRNLGPDSPGSLHRDGNRHDLPRLPSIAPRPWRTAGGRKLEQHARELSMTTLVDHHLKEYLEAVEGGFDGRAAGAWNWEVGPFGWKRRRAWGGWCGCEEGGGLVMRWMSRCTWERMLWVGQERRSNDGRLLVPW